MKESPIFTRSYDLHAWLLTRFEKVERYPPVCRSVLDHSRALLEAVTMALLRFDTAEHLVEADQHVALLRVHLRLAAEKKLIDDRQLLHANDLLRDIGRQIGGWLKHLDGVG